MKSTKTAPKDSAGVTFDPAIHQAFKNGTPRKTKDGRFFTKSRVDIAKARKRAAKAAAGTAPTGSHDGATTAPHDPLGEVVAAPVTAEAPDPVVAPVEHGPASVADIIGEFPEPTVTPGEPEAPAAPAPVEPGSEPL